MVIEAEHPNLPSNWKRETSKSPFTGNSYIIWRGGNSFGSPGSAKITYKVRINSPGKYRFIWRNVIAVVANQHPTTEHNDSWLKINADEFYGQKGSSRVWPKGSGRTPNPHGASGEGFFKVYANSLNWNWGTWTSDFNGHFIYAEFDSPGVYDIIVANRSNGHAIDRIVLYKEGQYSANQAQSLSRSQTLCGGGGTPPPPPPPPPGENEDPTVNITSPSNGATITAGSNVTVQLSANDSDGNITKHEIFVNGTRVDQDGTTYSAHTITNIQEGSYTIRAKVTDNDGGTAEDTVNITVGSGGGGNPPPPPPPPPGENEDPTVNITTPADGANLATGSNITVRLNADDSDGTVVKHQIYINNVLRDTDGLNYTPFTLSNAAAGSYEIRATVTDNDGGTASATVNVTVGGGGGTPPPPPPPPGGNNPPTVSITAPSNGANVAVGSTVAVRVNSSDSDGTVVKHQVYVNGVLRDTDPANYTPYNIVNIAAGDHTIEVVVTDDDGDTGSATVNISAGSGGGGTPPPPPPPSGGISLSLMNSTNNSVIGPLFDGKSIVDGGNKNVRVNVSDSNVKSVYMQLRGATVRNQTENAVPYALFGDFSGDYSNGTFNGGSHTLTVQTYSGQNRTGTMLESYSVFFTVAGGGKGAIAFPNPVKQGPVSVKLPEEIQGEAAYSIISSSGIEIERGTLNSKDMGAGGSLQIDSSGMKNDGVYYLVIQANYNSYTVPIVKQ